MTIKIALEKVLVVMVTDQQSFSAVTNPVTTVNNYWPVIILSAAYVTKG